MKRIVTSLVVALSLLAPGSAQTQEAASAPAVVNENVNFRGMVGGAVLGSVGGMIGGGIVGYQVQTRLGCSNNYCEDEGLGGILIGALAGSVVLTPVLAHKLGGGRGDVRAGLAMTAMATAGGVAALRWLGGVGIVVIPVSQIWAAVTTERETAHRRSR